jgi:hypothetical protein
MSPAEFDRYEAIVEMATSPTPTPDLKARYDQLSVLDKQQLDFNASALQQESDAFQKCNSDFTCYSNWCRPFYVTEHTFWFNSMVAYDAAVRDWANRYYKLATGLVENLSDPGQAKWILLKARAWIDGIVSIELGAAADWLFSEEQQQDTCLTRPPAPEDAETTPGNLPDVSVCPPTIDAIRFAAKWIFPGVAKNFELDVRVRCDNVRVDEGLGADVRDILLGNPPKFRKTATVFIGKPGGSWRSGSYVTFGEENHSAKPVVTDAGETNHDEGHGLDIWGNAAHQVVAGSVY